MNYSQEPEEWKFYTSEDWVKGTGFYISNYGNFKRVKAEGAKPIICKSYLVGNFPWVGMTGKDGKNRSRYVHRMVAEIFVPGKSEERRFVIHLDFNKKNNHSSNLLWVSKEEKSLHHKNMPAELKRKAGAKNAKLTVAKVKHIKRKLADSNRKTRMKMIAKQFGISEMQLYRIKVGENWGYVTID